MMAVELQKDLWHVVHFAAALARQFDQDGLPISAAIVAQALDEYLQANAGAGLSELAEGMTE